MFVILSPAGVRLDVQTAQSSHRAALVAYLDQRLPERERTADFLVLDPDALSVERFTVRPGGYTIIPHTLVEPSPVPAEPKFPVGSRVYLTRHFLGGPPVGSVGTVHEYRGGGMSPYGVAWRDEGDEFLGRHYPEDALAAVTDRVQIGDRVRWNATSLEGLVIDADRPRGQLLVKWPEGDRCKVPQSMVTVTESPARPRVGDRVHYRSPIPGGEYDDKGTITRPLEASDGHWWATWDSDGEEQHTHEDTLTVVA